MNILYTIAPCLAPFNHNEYEYRYKYEYDCKNQNRDAVSITIEYATGKYADIINGEYLPTISTLDNDLIYKKSNNSSIQIQYCNFWKSWKLVYLQEKHGASYTIGRIKSMVKRAPLENLKNIYWEIIMSDGTFEFQPYIQIHIFGEEVNVYNLLLKPKNYVI